MDKSNESEFLSEALLFFYEIQWLCDTPVTEILTRGSLDNFPEEWLETLQQLKIEELNDFVTKKTIKSQWPSSLTKFIEKCKYLDNLPNINPSLTLELPKVFTIGLNMKKQHEILYLTHLVHEQCKLRDIKMIVDLGAGLGYVCQLLYHLHGYKVLGLEGNKAHVDNAQQRQKKLYPESLNHVKYATCKLSSESARSIESIVLENFGYIKDICLIGLHACGDLSIHASEIFSSMKNAQLLILISCCYHKLCISQNIEALSKKKQYFHNFPKSQCFKDTVKTLNLDIGNFLRLPFLRLACQETADRWTNMSAKCHNEHSFHVLARAVLELYAHQNGCFLKKLVRKSTRKSQCINIESYIDNSLSRYSIEPVKGTHIRPDSVLPDERTLKTEIMYLWNKHLHKLKVVEIYTALQMVLQGPAEALVLQDRLYWFQEQGFRAMIVPVMDRTLSPRSHAIVSQKRL